MNAIPIEVSFNIIDFLSVPVQMNVCKSTRNRSIPKAKKSIYKIRSAMKVNRSRMLKSILLDTHSTNIQRSALSLYISPINVDKCLNHILRRGDPDYIQDTWTMCMDDRNGMPYPETVKDQVILGNILEIHPKKTFRHAMKQLDQKDLDSLMLVMDSL